MKHSIIFLIGGCALFVIGVALRLKIGQRRFRRRGVAGLEYFPSYRRALVTRFLEGIVGAAAKLFMIVGALLVAYYFL